MKHGWNTDKFLNENRECWIRRLATILIDPCSIRVSSVARIACKPYLCASPDVSIGRSSEHATRGTVESGGTMTEELEQQPVDPLGLLVVQPVGRPLEPLQPAVVAQGEARFGDATLEERIPVAP